MALTSGHGAAQTPLIRIGTRGSKLALAQAQETRNRLMTAHGLDQDAVEIVTITTTGDRIRDRPLAEIGGKGLFTKEIEEALFAGAIDLAVHSMKDMPAVIPEGLAIAAYLPREDARDALISPVARRIADLPQGAAVGTSSVRRAAQLLRRRPDLRIVPFRGNVDTRIRKLEGGEVQATLLACAGLNRLGLALPQATPIAIEEMLPAVAQGAIGIEIRTRDEKVRGLIAAINDGPTQIRVICERAFLAALDGSCRTPLAGHAILEGGEIRFRGEALSEDGTSCFESLRNGSPADAARLGRDAGEEVKALGGKAIAF
ncbi:MAG: hydroxymethylbilane synthase [Rhizobiales bacterium]|nr:hydroxymethylbilane synthase [Hyphomicrobiales bacterium]